MRTNIVSLIVGGRGTGKSTYLQGSEKLSIKGIIGSYLERNPNQKILIVEDCLSMNWADVAEIKKNELKRWIKGVRRYVLDVEDMKTDVRHIVESCYNTVLIFEDATRYIDSGKLPMHWRKVPADSKQKNSDVFFVFHALMQVPPDLVRLSNFVVLFKTNENLTSSLKNKYPFPVLHSAFEKVQKNKNAYYHTDVRIG